MNGKDRLSPIRTLDLRAAAPAPRGATRCSHPGCERGTRHTKPYCTDHIHLLPYVTELLGDIDDRTRERERVRRRGPSAVDLGSGTTEEILTELRLHGCRSVGRLAKDLALDGRVVAAYVHALEDGGVVDVDRRRRRRRETPIVRPVRGGPAASSAVAERASVAALPGDSADIPA
ncbi:MAG: hypothetical protein AB7N76_01640 [Planctomycetota bacterium]